MLYGIISLIFLYLSIFLLFTSERTSILLHHYIFCGIYFAANVYIFFKQDNCNKVPSLHNLADIQAYTIYKYIWETAKIQKKVNFLMAVKLKGGGGDVRGVSLRKYIYNFFCGFPRLPPPLELNGHGHFFSLKIAENFFLPTIFGLK